MMRTNHIDTIVFDLGNVLVHVDERRAAEQIAAKTNMNMEDVYTKTFNTCEDSLDKFSRGEIAADVFYEIIASKLGFYGTYVEFTSIWLDMFSPMQSMIDFAKAMHGKIRRFLLSNTNELHCDYLLREYPFLNNFDGLMFSQKVGLLKPDIRIYQLAKNKFNLNLDKSVFIDDRIENILGAQSAGWMGIHFKTMENVRQQLTNLGLPPI